MKSFRQFRAEQELRIESYLRKKLTTEEIADREGISGLSQLNKRLNLKADSLGISRAGGQSYKVPFGLTSGSVNIRRRLAYLLADVILRLGKYETARLIGLSPKRQIEASLTNGTPTHNWTLAELERLAPASGMTLSELFEHITRDYRKKREWPILQNRSIL